MVDDDLAEPDPATRRKAVADQLRRAKEATTQANPQAEEGIYRKGTRNGLTHYDVAVAALNAEMFESCLTQGLNPRTEAGQAARDPHNQGNVVQGTFGTQVTEYPDFLTEEEAATGRDEESQPLSAAARRLNALMTFLTVNTKRLRALVEAAGSGEGQLPKKLVDGDELKIPTIAPRVVVMLTLAELEERALTHGVTSHGFELSATQLRQILARGKIIPMVLGGQGEILDIGRSQREHPGYMRLGISVRDRGCIVPGCTMEPEHCEIHHIWLWSHGGVTAVYWSAMLCVGHHHDVHAGLIRVIPDGGVPKVILPNFIDPTQSPVRNTINRLRAA